MTSKGEPFFETDHEFRLRMAAEGKAIYSPGKTVEEMKAEAAQEAERLARVSRRQVALTNKNWERLDTAIPDVVQMLFDVRDVFTMFTWLDDLDTPAVNAVMRIAARAVDSMTDNEMAALERAGDALRRARTEDAP